MLNDVEVRLLLKACVLLKHKLLITLSYGWGLRCCDGVGQLRIGNVDTERGMAHVHQGKGKKDWVSPNGCYAATWY